MASQWPPKKNTAFTLFFTLYKNDGTVVANPGTITKKVSIDGAAVADITAAITEEDTTYGQCSVVLANTEMNGDAIWIYITDNTAGTVPFTCTLYTAAATLDEVKAETAALYAAIVTNAAGTDIAADIIAVKAETAAIKTKTDYLPSATAGAAGGVFIAGANAATSITTALTANITGNLSGSVGSVTGAAGSVTGAVGSVTGFTAANIATIMAKTDNLPAAPAAVSDIPTAVQNADAILARDIGSGTGAGTSEERTVRSALRFIRNKWGVAAGTLTVTKEDDVTAAWTAAVASDANAVPVIGSDPT